MGMVVDPISRSPPVPSPLWADLAGDVDPNREGILHHDRLIMKLMINCTRHHLSALTVRSHYPMRCS
jgi:hypothetical protein